MKGQTQEPVGGMKDQCSHEWVGYSQCCYCGAMKNHKGEILPLTTHPQYPVKKLAEDFEEWYFSIKNDTGKPPLAMQIFYWFSKHLNLFDELVKSTSPPSPVGIDVEALAKEYADKWLPNDETDDWWENKDRKNKSLEIEEHFENGFKAGYAASQNIVGPMLSIPPDVLRKALAKGTGHSSVDQNEFLNFCIENKITLK